MTSKRTQLLYWNGNKSSTRREYEKQLLSLCLAEAGMLNAEIIVDETDYPAAEDEGNILSQGCDVLVTVAGNQKFLGKPTLIIDTPVCRGILGHRLLLIPKRQAARFAALKSKQQLQNMTIGIPATWADADLFRKNGFNVSEKGNLENLSSRLLEGECDYIALGANEVESVLESFKKAKSELLIEPNILIYYPLPLVFYVNTSRQKLANLIEQGLKKAIANGKHQALFDAHHPNLVSRLSLRTRKTFHLANPYLPPPLQAYCPPL